MIQGKNMNIRLFFASASLLTMSSLISACQSNDNSPVKPANAAEPVSTVEPVNTVEQTDTVEPAEHMSQRVEVGKDKIEPMRETSANTDQLLQASEQVNTAGSVPENITAEELAQLDVLTDYDRDLWSGPESWDKNQWFWKKTLKWDSQCDYVAEVNSYKLQKSLQLVSIQCVPGAYQPMSYLYLFDTRSKQSKQLNLGLPGSTDKLKEIFGNIEFSQEDSQLAILTLSRGMGDCGTYRVFQLSQVDSLEASKIKLAQTRHQNCEDHSGQDFEKLPKSLFDYQNWPLKEKSGH